MSRISLHVQENNIDALRFYERHGFKIVGNDPEYYKKIEPHGAWILEKDISSEAPGEKESTTS